MPSAPGFRPRRSLFIAQVTTSKGVGYAYHNPSQIGGFGITKNPGRAATFRAPAGAVGALQALWGVNRIPNRYFGLVVERPLFGGKTAPSPAQRAVASRGLQQNIPLREGPTALGLGHFVDPRRDRR